MSSDNLTALSLRAIISRFSKRPGCTTGAMMFTLVFALPTLLLVIASEAK
jgi:hypothetical protein